ncbi:MAG: hypothetical protein Q4P84_01155 [Elusimicrobiales bacterium]|nr:hypothetical protein [Elusimicrobiales bacterium]
MLIMANRVVFQTPDAMDFSKTFSSLSQRHNPWTIWSDFITMYACVISITFDRHDPKRFKERSDLFRNTAKRYSEQELTIFDSLFKTTAASLDRNPQQDFLAGFICRWILEASGLVSFLHLGMWHT